MPKSKTWNDWSKADQSRYSMLYTYLKTKIKDEDDFTFIENKKRNIMSQIENNQNWAVVLLFVAFYFFNYFFITLFTGWIANGATI